MTSFNCTQLHILHTHTTHTQVADTFTLTILVLHSMNGQEGFSCCYGLLSNLSQFILPQNQYLVAELNKNKFIKHITTSV